MSVAKMLELSARSEVSFEDAIKQAVARAGETLRGIQEVWVKDQFVRLEDGEIKHYEVHVKVTFVID